MSKGRMIPALFYFFDEVVVPTFSTQAACQGLRPKSPATPATKACGWMYRRQAVLT
jgi:hypothetical protein